MQEIRNSDLEMRNRTANGKTAESRELCEFVHSLRWTGRLDAAGSAFGAGGFLTPPDESVDISLDFSPPVRNPG